MAEKEPVIVIKKITINSAGHHGGAWKVAFADFMTALMAFFLVMWLVSQSEDVKKNVADYFSTPSIIEYNFANYGVELTLEKLFLDLVNEPLKFFEQFIRPVDFTPNIMAMGSKKVVLHHIADQLRNVAGDVKVNGDRIEFEIEDTHLFSPGTAYPVRSFIDIMEKVKALTAGLEDANVYIDSHIFKQSVSGKSLSAAKNVAEERLDLITNKIEVGLEHETVDMFGKTSVESYAKNLAPGESSTGKIKFRIKQKDFTKDGKKQRKLDAALGDAEDDMNLYDNFINKVSKKKTKKKKSKKIKH